MVDDELEQGSTLFLEYTLCLHTEYTPISS
jgi:hypothetical protein